MDGEAGNSGKARGGTPSVSVVTAFIAVCAQQGQGGSTDPKSPHLSFVCVPISSPWLGGCRVFLLFVVVAVIVVVFCVLFCFCF